MNIDGHDTPSSSAASFHRPEPKQRPEMTEKAEAFVQIQRNPECSQVPQQKSTNYPQNQAQSQSKLPTPEAASTLPSFLKTVSKPPVFYASATCGLMSIVEMDVCTTPNASASDHEENMMMLNAADPIEPGQIVANASNQQQQTVEQTAGLLPTDFQPQTNNKSVKGILVAHRKNSLIPPAMLQLVDFGDYFTVKAAIVSSSCIKKKEGLSSAADAPPDGTEQPSGVTPTNPQQKKLSANEKNPVQQQSNGVPKSAANNTAADVHIQLRPNNDDQDQPPSHQPVVMAAENLTNRHDQVCYIHMIFYNNYFFFSL
jgi:type II secretory ATPase GspE/PulE/Tfp pilus assembly ATPase PilB-like protein